MPAHLRRVNEPGHVHFWTISCHRRLAFFHHDGIKTIVVAALGRLQAKFGICIVGYVVMPDHVHGIVWIEGDDDVKRESGRSRPGLTDVMSAFKSISARRANAALGSAGRQVWQRSFYDRVIRTERELLVAREYIVDNPMAFAIGGA